MSKHKHEHKKSKVKTKSKAQSPKWKGPYQPGSNLERFFSAMAKRGGMTLKEFNKFLKKLGASTSFILRVLRKGRSSKGWSWEFDDSNDRYRITNLKDLRKK